MNEVRELKTKGEKKTVEDLIWIDAVEEKRAEEWLDYFLKHPLSISKVKTQSSKNILEDG
jgi:hypothetical protein